MAQSTNLAMCSCCRIDHGMFLGYLRIPHCNWVYTLMHVPVAIWAQALNWFVDVIRDAARGIRALDERLQCPSL